MKAIDTIINARWVIPVDPSDSVLENHSIAISGNRIHSIFPTGKAKANFDDSVEHVDLTTHAVLPGFVNAHTHAAMSLFRGIAEDLPLQAWLQEKIWPLESEWISEEFVRDGARLAFAEMIRSGTTCMNDMYFFPEVVGEVAQSVGMRACLGMIVLEFPTVWAGSASEYLEKGMALHDQYKDEELVSTILAPHAPYTVFDQTLEKIVELSAHHDFPVHMHIHETADEVKDSMAEHKMRPIERLRQIGLVNSKLLAVHVTQLTDEEMSLFSEFGCSVAHCPKSNLKLASGICPVADLLDQNVNVALGTDSATSNNSLNMLEEMRFASLLAKGTSGNAKKASVHEALRMSTINGAKSLGLDSEIGSLEAGKLADVIAINLSDLNTSPIYDPVAQIVYAATRNQVSDVWINGKEVLREQKLTNIDQDECLEVAKHWGKKILSRL